MCEKHISESGFYFVLGLFNLPFNTFQVISGQWLLVTEGMITTLYSLKYHIPGIVIWYPPPPTVTSYYSGNWSPSFCVELHVPFICQAFDKEASTTDWNLWFDSAGNKTLDLPDTEWILYYITMLPLPLFVNRPIPTATQINIVCMFFHASDWRKSPH